MEKTARKPSADPNQEKLRETKATWNKDVSAFVNDLIHFKKMMNGWPSKFFKERSRITAPIPADPASILGSLANDFQEITSRGNTIIQEQLNYSKTRRQHQAKQMNLPLGKPNETPASVNPEAQPAGPDLSKQLSLGLAADYSRGYHLVSKASNPFSRFFSRILSPGIGFGEAARIRKLRISLLNAAVSISKDLKAFQREIVPLFSGPESIMKSALILNKIEKSLIFVLAGLKSYKDALPQGATDTGGKIQAPQNVGEEKPAAPAPITQNPEISISPELESAVDDVLKHRNSFVGIPEMNSLYTLAVAFRKFPNEIKMGNLKIDTFMSLYHQVITKICLDRGLPPQATLGAIVAMGTKSTASDNQIQIVAQNILGKWRHQLSMSDKTSSFRLDLYGMAKDARRLNNNIMDKLEVGLNAEELTSLMNDLATQIAKIRESMTALSATTKGMSIKPQFINMLEHGRLTDHNINLNPQEKTRLEKLLDQKRTRDLTKMMYGK